jgi:hypothetical protein
MEGKRPTFTWVAEYSRADGISLKDTRRGLRSISDGN